MRPHTSPEVLLGSKSPARERLRRGSRALLTRLRLRPPDVIQEPDTDLADAKLRVGRNARALWALHNDRVPAGELKLRIDDMRAESRDLAYQAIARGEQEAEGFATRWSITIFSATDVATQLEILQSDPASGAPNRVNVAEGGTGRHVYREEELSRSQALEMYTTAARVLDHLGMHGETVPSHTLPAEGASAQING